MADEVQVTSGMDFTDVRRMLVEVYELTDVLEGQPIADAVDYHGQNTTPAMLLSLGINRLRRAAEHLDSTRLTYFGFTEP